MTQGSEYSVVMLVSKRLQTLFSAYTLVLTFSCAGRAKGLNANHQSFAQ